MDHDRPREGRISPLGAGSPDGEAPPPYCRSRFTTVRRRTREVAIGNIRIGGDQPIRVQSMTTTVTDDIEATVGQTLALAEAGCDIVRITAPTTKSARALKEIVAKIRAARVDVPIVADIHFSPRAALEAAEHVDKVRINPGNYVDTKKFKVREYSDADYQAELERLHEGFSPIVLKCKELGRSMRIGTNHGSLSDRIMNRFGDTPEGMVESALEFIRIAEGHGFHDIVLSMKASNPKIMVQAYRLAVARMEAEGMDYPLHLGVTEAGDGEDGRVKSSIGIGSLLYDGLGDTIRVSLTEDPVAEVPIGRDLARRAEQLWATGRNARPDQGADSVDPYDYQRRPLEPISVGRGVQVAIDQPPSVITRLPWPVGDAKVLIESVCAVQARHKEAKIEGLHLEIREDRDLEALATLGDDLASVIRFLVLDGNKTMPPEKMLEAALPSFPDKWLIIQPGPENNLREEGLAERFSSSEDSWRPILDLSGWMKDPDALASRLETWRNTGAILTLSKAARGLHPLGAYRLLAEELRRIAWAPPIWIRNTRELSLIPGEETFKAHLVEASMLSGALLCDGIGDLLSVEAEPDPARSTALAYNILQGSKARITRTEFVACPSCGRTLFDLQTTTARIRERTEHLKGVTIAIMGCIVNGPGEMADADFGYVGGAPGKVNLYVGKTCVKVGIPEAEAVDRLIDLIREHGKWTDPQG